jgi:hypothetical protein
VDSPEFFGFPFFGARIDQKGLRGAAGDMMAEPEK